MSSTQSMANFQDGSVPVVSSEEVAGLPSTSADPSSPWRRLIQELEGFLAPWPEEIDDLTLAAYLAGMATPEQQAQIEQAAARSAVLSVALEVSQEVLNHRLPNRGAS